MVYYVMLKNDILTYLGYDITDGEKGSIGPNGTYVGKEGFIKDKTTAKVSTNIFIGRTKEFTNKHDVIIEVPYFENFVLSKEEKLKIKVPEIVRRYLLALTYINKLFDKTLPYNTFFKPKRYANPLMVGNNAYYIPGHIDKNTYLIVTNPPGEIGRNASSALYSIVETKEPIKYINELVTYYEDALDGFENPVCIYVNNINSQVPAMILRDFPIEDLFISNMDYHREAIPVFKLGEDLPLLEMVVPPLLAFRAITRLDELKVIFNKFTNNKLDKRYAVHDITDTIWENETLHKDIKAGKKLRVTKVDTLPISFIPDIDIPSFNSLNKLSKTKPKLSLLLEDEGAASSYSFILETDIGRAIYFSYFSNRVFKRALRKKKS